MRPGLPPVIARAFSTRCMGVIPSGVRSDPMSAALSSAVSGSR
jgi:hypothetical protein